MARMVQRRCEARRASSWPWLWPLLSDALASPRPGKPMQVHDACHGKVPAVPSLNFPPGQTVGTLEWLG